MPDGQTVLYDAGASGTIDAGRTIIVPFLRHRRVRRVDGVILSHPNLDHFSGLLSVVDAMDMGPVYVSPWFEGLSDPRRPSHALLAGLREREVSVREISSADPVLRFGAVTLDILWPPPDPPFAPDANDSSLVVAVHYAGSRILLTGDIEYAAQQWLIDHADLRADVLLLPHHGGIVGNTRAFIDAVNPRHVIRSTSQSRGADGNRLTALLGRRPLYNTADGGAITVVITGAGVRFGGPCAPVNWTGAVTDRTGQPCRVVTARLSSGADGLTQTTSSLPGGPRWPRSNRFPPSATISPGSATH
jgi:competence protein ComEC